MPHCLPFFLDSILACGPGWPQAPDPPKIWDYGRTTSHTAFPLLFKGEKLKPG